MPALTNTLANSLINAVLRATAYTSPGTVYLGVYTTAPAANGSGTEVTGGSYTRVAMTFAAPSGGVTSNTNEVDIIGMPAVTIRGLALMDSSSSGTMLFYGSLATPKTTNARDTFTVKLGDFSVAMV